MLSLTPIAGAPTSDFHNDLLFIEKVASGGAVAGGACIAVRILQVHGVGGATAGGSSPEAHGSGGSGYPIYGDIGYGDMPYLERQFTMQGGAIVGGTADIQQIRQEVAVGGAIAGGLAPYIRIWCQVATGGALGGGWSDEDGDFSKIITVEFLLNWPEVLFVPPSERWDIPNILRSLE